MARALRALPLVGVLVAASLWFSGVSSAVTVDNGYNISVASPPRKRRVMR